MAISMESYISMQNAYMKSGVSQMSQIFDFSAAQKQAQSLANTFKANNTAVNTLKKETADFLKTYTGAMNAMNASAGKLAGGNINSVLQDKQGAVTEDTVKNTVDAVKTMVNDYNSALKTLNDNAERGPAVVEQAARMAGDPASAKSMQMVGVSVNKDGSLAVDEAKLTEALSTENTAQRTLYSDIVDDIASGVQSDARAGLSTSAQRLVGNDVAEMQSIRENDPIRQWAQSIRGGGAFALNNSAAIGILMNMVV